MRRYITRKYFYKLLISFLLIGVLPLLIVGPITYILTKTILYKRAYTLSELLSSRVEETMGTQFARYESAIDTIITDKSFFSLFSSHGQEELARLYDSLYLLFSNDVVKPGVHIIDKDFNVLMNTTTSTPKEYYQEQFRSWGVIRKTLLAHGSIGIYYHRVTEDDNRRVTLAKTKLLEQGDVEGIIVLDLYTDHINSLIPFQDEFKSLSLVVLDEHNNKAISLQGDINDDSLNVIIESPHLTGVNIKKSANQIPCIYSFSSNEQYHFTILSYYPLTQIDELLHLLAFIVIAIAGVVTVMCVILALFVSRNAAKPLQEAVDVLERVGNGDFSARTNIHRSDEFGKLGLSVNEMVVRMKQLIDTNRQKEQSLRASEIKSLMSQTKPHFIFNCLETIKWYILLGEIDEAIDTIVDLGMLLRSNIDLGEGIVSVEEEIEVIKKYLALQKRRMGERVHVAIEIDPSILSVQIPRLLFQPVVENAVMHGLEKKRGRGEIRIKVYKEMEYLHFIVEDNGMGMNQEEGDRLISYHEISDVKDGGSGLQNLIRRLRLYYGENAGMRIITKEKEGTIVSIYISLKVGL